MRRAIARGRSPFITQRRDEVACSAAPRQLRRRALRAERVWEGEEGEASLSPPPPLSLFLSQPLSEAPANDAREAQRLLSLNGVWFSGVGALAALPTVGAPAICDSLRQAALHGGRSEWQTAWAALDAGPLAELRQRQQAGESVALWLCGERWAKRWVSAPATGWTQRLRRSLGLHTKPSVADILGSL